MSETSSVPPGGSRGPRRPRIEEAALQDLITRAHDLSRRISEHTTTTRELTAQRHDLIRQLYAGGISIRAIATTLGLATSTVQTAIEDRDRVHPS